MLSTSSSTALTDMGKQAIGRKEGGRRIGGEEVGGREKREDKRGRASEVTHRLRSSGG